MPVPSSEVLTTPRADDLGLARIANGSGLSVSILPNGCVFAFEHVHDERRILINQVLGSPLAGAMGHVLVRRGGSSPRTFSALGPARGVRAGKEDDRVVWEADGNGLRCRVCLWLHPDSDVWLWRIEVTNQGDETAPCDAIFIQDLGLGEQNFLMGNEAYASQYLDHFVARHPRAGHVLMTRQNLAQGGVHPWVAHGCLEGAAGYVTDFREAMGPAHRDADPGSFGLPFGEDLVSKPLQFETACAAIQTRPAALAPGAKASWTIFGAFERHHPLPSSEADLKVVARAESAAKTYASRAVPLAAPPTSLSADARAARAKRLRPDEIRALYPKRLHVERSGERELSFFTPGRSHSRHVVLRDKERMVWRRHGAILRSGADMLPSESLLSATCWMHGVFAAQLTIGNTSFHKLFSVSRDPYNITRGSGLRLLVDFGEGWRLLTVPSAFDMGFSDCRWIYRLADRVIVISAKVAATEPAMTWRISVEGEPCRFLLFGNLVLGEHEFAHKARVEIDSDHKSIVFRPDPDGSLWGARYPKAAFRLVTSTPDGVDAIGADELLYADGKRRSTAYVAIRTIATRTFAFAVVGSLSDPAHVDAMAAKYAALVDDAALSEESERAWRTITRGVRLPGAKGGAKAVDTILPWFVHDAMVHLTVPHGLEQYTGAAWGTRDVCQGPLELFLSLEHDDAARSILRTVFAQQYEQDGDWPQWFMLEPYSAIQDRHAHGDVIVWPLKALCDYVEATGDVAFLDEKIPWRREDDFQPTERTSRVVEHAETLLDTVQRRFVRGTRLIRYGAGDWNDSLQPADPDKRDRMVSSWTVALLYQQVRRYAGIRRLTGETQQADRYDALADGMRDDFNRFLVRDGIVAGYGIFESESDLPDLLLHPQDRRTGVTYSLIPMTQAIIGGLFTPEQARAHLAIIEENLLFPDGARLMEKPLAYHGGLETIFRRAESAAFFGREIGLMYTHSHLRYAEAMALLGKPRALWDALLVANPIAVTDTLENASLRQRNAYFSSSDAAFRDRREASESWNRVRGGSIAVDGGWRIYSSGPGLYLYILIQHAFGARRHFGKRSLEPRLPRSERSLQLAMDAPHRLGAAASERRS